MNEKTNPRRTNGRHACFLGLMILAAAVIHRPLAVVVESSVAVDQYSQVLLVAPIGGLFLYLERRKIFAKVANSLVGGGMYLACLGAFAYVDWHSGTMDPSNFISASVLLFVLACIAAFLFCYGMAALRAGSFPLFFLLLLTPLPDGLRERIISFLQSGSALVTAWLFTAAGVPFRRDGVVLTLPLVTIEIAEECSGIRSSMVLFLVSLVLGYLYLKSRWSRLALMVWLVPLTIIKNGVRIFTLCMLGMYVNRSFLTGSLHHHGGFVFFGLAFLALWAGVWVLQRIEARTADAPPPNRGVVANEKAL